MPILTIIFALVVAGVLLYVINKFVPMDGKIKSILNWAVVIILIIWLIKVFGLLDSLKSVHT